MVPNFVRTVQLLPVRYFYFYLDREPYAADRIFVDHKLRVHFACDWEHDVFPYDVVMCWVWFWQRRKFEECMAELREELGSDEYELACQTFLEVATDGQ